VSTRPIVDTSRPLANPPYPRWLVAGVDALYPCTKQSGLHHGEKVAQQSVKSADLL
jgi:hypothetical protein